MKQPGILLELTASSTGAKARVTLNAADGEILEDSGIVDVFGLDAAFELASEWCRIKAHTSFEFDDRRNPRSRRFGMVIVENDPGLEPARPKSSVEDRPDDAV